MIVAEEVVCLYVDGEKAFEWRCTPEDLDALVLGRLFIERTARKTERAHVELPASDTFAELFRDLFARVDAKYPDGGMHAAALVRDNAIVHHAADVGRHNAVDKVIGRALLSGDKPAEFGMIVTSRVSGEIARKCVSGDVAWLASRSVPTSLAVQHASEARMPIVGRAAGKNAFVYR